MLKISKAMESKVKCTTEGCDGIGQSEFLGKCHKCFHDNTNSFSGASDSDLPNVSDPVGQVVADSGERETENDRKPRKCIISGCTNFGSPQNNFFCNGCTSFIQREIGNKGISGEHQKGTCLTPYCPNDAGSGEICDRCKTLFASRKALISTQVSSNKCVTETCNNYGNAEKGNLCNECYNNPNFNCRIKNCKNLSSARNDFMCSVCRENRERAAEVYEPAVCSTPNCSRPAEARFDWKCEQCYASKKTVCKGHGCKELAATEEGLCLKCSKQMPAISAVAACGSGDSAVSYTRNPLIAPSGSNLMPTCLNVSGSSSTAGAESESTTDWKQCSTPGCGNVGSSTHGLCSDCYIQQYDNSSNIFLGCITPGCKEQGRQQLNGFCQKCHRSGKNLDSSKLAIVTGDQSTKCITPSCEFFGCEEQGGRCSNCFNEYLESIEAITATPSRTQLSAFDHVKCRNQGCDFFGNPKTKGFCSGCFRNYLEEESTPSNNRRRPVSGPSTCFNSKIAPGIMNNSGSTYGASALEVPGGVEGEMISKVHVGGVFSPLIADSYPNPKHQNGTPEILIQGPDKAAPPSQTTGQIIPETQTAVQASVLSSGHQESPQTSVAAGVAASTRQNDAMEGSSQVVQESPPPLISPSQTEPRLSDATSLQPVNSSEHFEGSSENRKLFSTGIPRSNSTPTGFTVLSHKCKNAGCERQCVWETSPYCMSCYEDLEVQPGSSAEAASMPVSPQTVAYLNLDQSSRLRSCSNPDLPSLSDVCEMTGCNKPVSPLHYAMCKECAEQTEMQGKAIFGVTVQESHSTEAASQSASREVTAQQKTTGSRSEEDQVDSIRKKKVKLKPATLDPCDVSCDVMVCLWNKHNIDTGTHPLLAKTGTVIHSMDIFRSALLRDQVFETPGGTTKSGFIVHCKYDLVTEGQIKNALLRCVNYTEAKRKVSIVLPVAYCENLNKDPRLATRVCLHVISHLQTTTNYTQCLEKLLICVAGKDDMKLCKEEFVRIDARSVTREMPAENRPNCHSCKRNPSAKLKPVSPSCVDPCSVFCIPCLKLGRDTGLHCPQHGPCLAPVGHKNTYALLVAGFDKRPKVAEIFNEDTSCMERALTNKDIIGISHTNMEVIKAANPGTEEDIRSRVLAAFTNLQKKMKGSSHAVFYFYYSGHNDKKALKLGGRNNTITPKELKQEFRKLDAENIIIILDCCYSGGANLTEEVSDEDFMMSLNSCSKDDSEPMMYLPKLWNLEGELEEDGAKGNTTQVFQWASSVAEEKSYFRTGTQSFFTHCIVKALKGDCPSKELGRCEWCKVFKQKVLRADGIYLNMINESVMCHVPQLAAKMGQQQHPQLDSNNDNEDNFLFAFHFNL